MVSIASISQQIWDMKYRLKAPAHGDMPGEPIDKTIEDTWRRVAAALAAPERDPAHWAERFYAAIDDFKFLPAGRVIAGAGSARDVTLFNCFVMGAIPDDMGGIFAHLREAALTMQQGGGIGYDFSTLRPKGTLVKGVGADALHQRALRPQGREIIADPAALLHRQRRLAQMREDAPHVVGDGAHHEAIEERHIARAAGAGDDPAGGQELEVVDRGVEALGPMRGIAFRGGEGGRDAAPGVLDRLVDRLAGHIAMRRRLEPILHVPDLLRDRGDADHSMEFRAGAQSAIVP